MNGEQTEKDDVSGETSCKNSFCTCYGMYLTLLDIIKIHWHCVTHERLETGGKFAKYNFVQIVCV